MKPVRGRLAKTASARAEAAKDARAASAPANAANGARAARAGDTAAPDGAGMVYTKLNFWFCTNWGTDPDPGGTYMRNYLAGEYDGLPGVLSSEKHAARYSAFGAEHAVSPARTPDGKSPREPADRAACGSGDGPAR